jgi:hypothetical protein
MELWTAGMLDWDTTILECMDDEKRDREERETLEFLDGVFTDN